MGQITFQGANRARMLNDVRMLREFRIGPTGQRVGVSAVYSDRETGLAWIECNTGRWRLPHVLFEWAEIIEERAADVVGHEEVFPCRAVFEETMDGEIIVEIFPDGYPLR